MNGWKLIIGLMLVAACSPVWAWDGNWTNATSGGWPFYDSGDKHGDSGSEERPEKFFIPPNPQFDDVDPEEISDNERKDYSPYALARFTRGMTINGARLEKGYYLVKPGHYGDGSANQKALPPLNSVQAQAQSGSFAAKMNTFSPSQARINSQQRSRKRAYDVLVLKQTGKVVAVLPIDERQVYVKAKGEKLPRQAIAWVEPESALHPERAVLKFLHKKQLYITHLGQL